MTKNKILVLSTQSGDWEGLFIDGKLISEGHKLGEGNSKKFWIDMCKKYELLYEDIVEKELNYEDEQYMDLYGGFPTILSELKGDY